MIRKIIKQGHNTLTVTLPSDWVKKLGLSAGDEINLFENQGSLVFNGQQRSLLKSTTIDISGFSMPMIWRFFQGAYREGCDEIKLVYDKDKKNYESAYNFYASQFSYTKMGEKPKNLTALEMITELVNRFIGMAVVDNGDNFCIIKEMGEVSAKEFEISLRRIFLLILELFEEVIELIKENKTGDISVCKKIHMMDINVDRFIDYCCRINNKVLDSTFQKNKQLMFSSLFILELLSDEFKYIGTHIANSKKKVEDILPFAEDVKKHLETYYHLFYKFNREQAIEFGKLDHNLYNAHFGMKESSNKEVNSMKRHFMQISKFTFALMELRIEMEY